MIEGIIKLLVVLKESIKSLRWWALAILLISVYLKYSPTRFQPFVSLEYLRHDDRLQVLGLTIVIAAIVFLVGWIAAGFDFILASVQRRTEEISNRRAKIKERQEIRKTRRAEDRLERRKRWRELRKLSPNQLSIVKLALRSPDGILKVKYGAALDLATTLVTKNLLTRIRSWYNEHGVIIGEVFGISEWVQEFKSELDNEEQAT